MDTQTQTSEVLLIARLQLLLAEQRTHYSLFRTGIAMFTIAPSTILFLIATNKFHHALDHWWSVAVSVGILSGLAVTGAMQARMANKKVKKIERVIKDVTKHNSFLQELMI